MRTIIFLTQKRFECYELENVQKLPHERFVLLLSAGSETNFPKYLAPWFDRIVNLAQLSLEEIDPILKEETELASGAVNLRLLVTDELLLLMGAKLRERWNIPGMTASEILPYRDKNLMKALVAKAGIKTPKFLLLDDLISSKNPWGTIGKKIGTPFVIKPIQGASSASTYKIQRPQELHDFYQKDMLVEEYVEGILYHCDSYVHDSKVAFSTVNRYLFPCLNYLFGKPIGSLPLHPEDPLKKQILQFNAKVLKALGMHSGPYHLECFVRSNGEIVFLEVAARPPGGFITHSLSKSTGVIFYQLQLLDLLDRFTCSIIPDPCFHAWAYFPLLVGKITHFNPPKLISKHTIQWKVSINDTNATPPTSVTSPSSCFLEWSHQNYSMVAADFFTVQQSVPVEYKTRKISSAQSKNP